MSVEASTYDSVLDRVNLHARRWLASVGNRRVGPVVSADEIAEKLGGPLPAQGAPPEEVIDQLAAVAEPGLMAIGSGRFYGWVMGGVLPAALGADWLVSAWDQNTGLRYATPATAAAEEVAAYWLLDLLGLPATADVGFVTGGMMANFTCLAAARTAVLARG
ncbi:MAG: aspartate aminotransferase family protein, partial [Candidatus Dormiibacterota bacterium]